MNPGVIVACCASMTRVRARREVADVGGGADRDESAVLDGERLGARRVGIDCVHARVDDDEVGLDARSGARRGLRLRRQ